MKILIAVTGSISAYKILDVITGLKNLGHSVKVVATENAKNFVTEYSLGAISEGNYLKEDINNIAHELPFLASRNNFLSFRRFNGYLPEIRSYFTFTSVISRSN